MKAKHKQVKILIIEDYSLTRKGLKMLLIEEGGYEVVAEAVDGEEGIRLARVHRPDLVIIDIGLPTMNGLECCGRVMKLLPGTRVLILSMHRDKDIIREAVRMGVHGYLLKEDAGFLLDALRMILKGERYLSASLSTVVADIIMSMETSVLKSQELEKLSLREVQVLSMTVAGESQSAIAKKLFISPDTVKTHRMRIKRKLNLKSFSAIRESALGRYLNPPQ